MKNKSLQFVHFYFFFLAGPFLAGPIFYRVTYGILKERKEKFIMGRDRDLVSPIRCVGKDDLGKNNNLDENTTTNRDQNTTNNDLDENTTTTNRDQNTTDEFVESMDEDRQALELDRQTEEALTKSALDREIEKERKREEFIRIRQEFLYSKELMKSKEFLSMDDKTREELEIAAKKKQNKYNEACRKSDSSSWETCENCEESNLVETLHLGYFICQHCGYHMKMDSYSRIEFSIDRHTWIPMNRNITSIDPIKWDLIWNEWYLRVVDSLRQRLKQQYERFKYERLKRNSDDSDDTRTPEDRNLLKSDPITNSCIKKNVNNSNIDQNQDDLSEVPDPMKIQIEFPTLGELSQTPENKTAKDQDPEIDQEAYTYIHSMISSSRIYSFKFLKEQNYDFISKEKEKFPEEQLSNTKDGSEDSDISDVDYSPFEGSPFEGGSNVCLFRSFNLFPSFKPYKCDDSDMDDSHFDRVSDDYSDSDSEDMEIFENYSENSPQDSDDLDVENWFNQGCHNYSDSDSEDMEIFENYYSENSPQDSHDLDVENWFNQGCHNYSDKKKNKKGYIENYSDERKSEFDQGSDDLEDNFLYDHGSDLSSGLVSYSDHVSDSSSEVENDDSCNWDDSYSELDDSEGSSYASDVRNSSSDRNSGSPKMSDSYESSGRLSSDSSGGLSSSNSEKESKESREFSSFSLEELSILSIEEISILLKKELKKMEKILDEMRALILQPFRSLEPFDEFTTYLLFGLEPSEKKEEEFSLSEKGCTEDTDSEEGCTKDTDSEEGCTEDTDSEEGCTEDTDSEEGCTEDTDSKENQPYMDRLDSDQRKAGLTEAIQTGMGKFKGIPIAIGVMDFEIRGGSMGPAVGEKITRLIEYANHQWIPLILVCSSGGARMQEGILSLMQMAKISSALYEYQLLDKLFYLSILTTPTTGGVTASFGMLGDIILSEPDTHIAFAGKRVIEETLKVIVPEGFQEAEYLFEKGSFDSIVPRNFVKEVLDELLDFHGWNIENGKDSFCWMEKFPICRLDQWERLLLDQSELKELLELE